MTVAGWRRCRHCSAPIEPDRAPDAGSIAAAVRRAVAWAAGYCSAVCDEAAVVEAMAAGSAWWQVAEAPALSSTTACDSRAEIFDAGLRQT